MDKSTDEVVEPRVGGFCCLPRALSTFIASRSDQWNPACSPVVHAQPGG